MHRHLDDEVLGRFVLSFDTSPPQPPAANGPSQELGDAAARSHLAHCRACQARLSDLRAVRFQLGTLREPPLPDALNDTIAVRVQRQDPARWTHRAARRRLAAVGPRHLGIAATLAIGAGAVSMVLVNGPRSSGTPTSAPSNLALSSEQTTASGTTSPRAVRTSGNIVVPSLATAGEAGLVTSGRDYHHTTIAGGASDLLQRPIAHLTASADTAMAPTYACLAAVGNQIDREPATTWRVMGVEAARYDGRPATLFALVSSNAGNDRLALVVDGLCTDDHPVVLDQAAVVS